MGYKDSMNPYQAFNMNPANFSDPMGLLSIKQWFFGVSEGGANTIMEMGLAIGKKFAMYLMPERAKEIAGFSIHFNFTNEDKPIVTASIDREMTVGKMFVEDLKNMTLVIPAGKSLGNLIGNTIVGFNPNYSQELRDEFQMEAARGIAPTVASVSALFFVTKGITAKANSYFYRSVNSPKLIRMNLLESEAKFSGRLPKPKAYSNAFEMELKVSDFGKSREVHFNRANASLDEAIKSSPEFAALMEELIPGASNAVSEIGGRVNPPSWTWEHVSSNLANGRMGVMRLVPKYQHTPGSPWWRTIHPNHGASGGYSEWAIPAGAPRN